MITDRSPPAVKTGEFGRHIEFATPTTLENFLKALYTAQLVYPTAICTIKFSILCFYRRIFSVPSIKIPMYILGGIMIAWWISTVRPNEVHYTQINTNLPRLLCVCFLAYLYMDFGIEPFQLHVSILSSIISASESQI